MSWHRGNSGIPGGLNFRLLTSYPGARIAVPGVGFASRLPPGPLQPMYVTSSYDIQKNLPEEPNVSNVSKEQEIIRVSNNPEPTLQLGFGAVSLKTEPLETNFNEIEDNETEDNLEEKNDVNPNISKSFHHPFFNVKKEMFISGKGKKKKQLTKV